MFMFDKDILLFYSVGVSDSVSVGYRLKKFSFLPQTQTLTLKLFKAASPIHDNSLSSYPTSLITAQKVTCPC